MITRRDAENQATRCFEYNAAAFAAIVATVGLLKPRALPAMAASLGAGLALHAVCLFAIPTTRESLLRTTASLMEDHRNAMTQYSGQDHSHEMAFAAAAD